MNDNQNPPLGKLVYSYMKEKGITVCWLSNQMNCDRKKLYKFFNTSHCDNDFLEEICFLLRCDCFVYYSKKLADNEVIDKIM